MILGRFDNSAMRFYFTPNLRKYDLGLLTLGNMGINGPLSFTVPPFTDSITFTSVCYPECMVKEIRNFKNYSVVTYFSYLKKNLLDDGIYLISGIMHTHLLGSL